MKYNILRILLTFSIVLLFVYPESRLFADSNKDLRFNNENWYTLPHPRVAAFSVHSDGNASGFTENGITFVQYNVPNTYGIRVQRFEIQEHYHYIVEGEIADSFIELSSLLARAYNSTRTLAG